MTSDKQAWYGLRLDPLDVLFFRDGRPFDAANRVVGGLPNPQTLAGALRTALLARSRFQFRAFAEARRGRDVRDALKGCGAPDWILTARFRGPWLALARNGQPIEPLLPLPGTVVKGQDGGWLRARPLEGAERFGWKDDNGLQPLWRKGKPDTKAGSGFVTLTGIRDFLKDKDFQEGEFFRPDELYDFDNRTGIGVDADTLASKEGDIYGIRLLSLRPAVRNSGERARVCLYAELTPGDGAPGALKDFLAEPIPFGGEGHNVHAEVVQPCKWPPFAPTATRSLWYLATPAFLAHGRPFPDLREGLKLRAAASGAGVAVSGWDVARNGPRPTRFAVPAGAVYFVEGATPADGPFRFDDDALAEGWGFALQGIW